MLLSQPCNLESTLSCLSFSNPQPQTIEKVLSDVDLLQGINSFSEAQVLPTPYTMNPAPYTLHSTPYAFHPTPYTPGPTPYILHVAPP